MTALRHSDTTDLRTAYDQALVEIGQLTEDNGHALDRIAELEREVAKLRPVFEAMQALRETLDAEL